MPVWVSRDGSGTEQIRHGGQARTNAESGSAPASDGADGHGYQPEVQSQESAKVTPVGGVGRMVEAARIQVPAERPASASGPGAG